MRVAVVMVPYTALRGPRRILAALTTRLRPERQGVHFFSSVFFVSITQVN